jgi:hypothetical protein
MKLRAKAAERETAQRVHGFFADKCPVYISLRNAIAITTELVFEEQN